MIAAQGVNQKNGYIITNHEIWRTRLKEIRMSAKAPPDNMGRAFLVLIILYGLNGS